MGDVGALSLGAMLVQLRSWFVRNVFCDYGWCVLVEAISVFLQIGSLRMRNKRVF